MKTSCSFRHFPATCFCLFAWFTLLIPPGYADDPAAATSEDLQDKGHDQQTIATKEDLRILLIGDSTVCTYAEDRPIRGWGQLLPEFFNNQVSFLNAAAGGRSSMSFWNEGRWEKAKAFQPDVVFIQFGHNDQPGKGPERETDPDTTYREYLRHYIRESRAIGAQPILVTPVARRIFRNGKVVSSLAPWAEAMLAVGKEDGVPVIDLHALSIARYEALGDSGSSDYSFKKGDRTHFSEKGARVIAQLVVEQLPEKEPSLTRFLKRPLSSSAPVPRGNSK